MFRLSSVFFPSLFFRLQGKWVAAFLTNVEEEIRAESPSLEGELTEELLLSFAEKQFLCEGEFIKVRGEIYRILEGEEVSCVYKLCFVFSDPFLCFSFRRGCAPLCTTLRYHLKFSRDFGCCQETLTPQENSFVLHIPLKGIPSG